jgi:hypothetical protein
MIKTSFKFPFTYIVSPKINQLKFKGLYYISGWFEGKRLKQNLIMIRFYQIKFYRRGKG